MVEKNKSPAYTAENDYQKNGFSVKTLLSLLEESFLEEFLQFVYTIYKYRLKKSQRLNKSLKFLILLLI